MYIGYVARCCATIFNLGISFIFFLASNYLGCFKEGTFKACGQYRKDVLTPEVCTTCCGTAGYNYSAVKFGDQCLCSHDINPARKVEDQQCQIPCTGDPVLRCGGHEAYSVYQCLGKYNSPCSLTMPTNVSTLEKFTSYFNCQPGAVHSLDFGENMIFNSTETNVSYLYQSNGKHRVFDQVLLGDYGEPQSFHTALEVRKF